MINFIFSNASLIDFSTLNSNFSFSKTLIRSVLMPSTYQACSHMTTQLTELSFNVYITCNSIKCWYKQLAFHLTSRILFLYLMNSRTRDYFLATLPRHAKISRANTTITINVIVERARDILACFGNLPESNRACYEFMIYRNVQ